MQLSSLAGGAPAQGWTAWLRPQADEATLSRDSMPGTDGDAEWRRLTDEWHAAYWRSQEPWRHRVVTGPLPTLYDCFNHADLMITDISSVVADFIASGKPYVVDQRAGTAANGYFRERVSRARRRRLPAGRRTWRGAARRDSRRPWQARSRGPAWRAARRRS